MNRPSAAVLVVFVAVVLIGGTNFVAVRFSNRELPPFWGAGLRFAIAGALLVGFAAWRHIRLPLGSRFAGVALLGVLNFGLAYAFAYWGLLQAPSAMAATFVALVPLMTFFMTTALGMESFRWSGVVGGAIAVTGVALVFVDHSAPLSRRPRSRRSSFKQSRSRSRRSCSSVFRGRIRSERTR